MKVSLQQTEKLLKGNQAFNLFAFSMMLTRLRIVYEKNPIPATLSACTEEVNAFLSKFSEIMTSDYEIIQRM